MGARGYIRPAGKAGLAPLGAAADPVDMDALVTDAQIRWAVAGLRALGRSGLDVMALGTRRAAAGLWSRYAAATEVGPDSIADPRGFAATVARLASEHGPLVVYPGHEEAIDALFDADLPDEAVLPYPGAEATQSLRDKRALAAMAEGAGLAAPATLGEATAGELRGAPIQAPCVVKPSWPGGALETTRVIDRPEQLHALLSALPASEPLLVQERASGPLIGLALVLARDGSVAARFQQVARRTWPPEAGGSTLAVSEPPDEALVDRSAAMLRDAGYWGLAQLQFLRVRSGNALIDVNTRFYGSMPLALAAGANLPAAWHAVTLERSVPPPEPYRIGVTYRWLESELIAAVRRSPRLLFERAPRPRAGAMWAADDPVPGALLAFSAGAVRVRRRAGRLKAGKGRA